MDEKYIKALETIAKDVREEYDQRTNPERIYETLKSIVESCADNAPYNEFRGTERNNGIDLICDQLNRLQDELIFQIPYKVEVCESKKL